jgi:hypothetical protein
MNQIEVEDVKKEAIKLRKDIRKRYNEIAVEVNKTLLRVHEVSNNLDKFLTEIIGDEND